MNKTELEANNPKAETGVGSTRLLGDKCIVFGCSNHTSQGRFIGVLCAPCHHYITTGKIGCTDSFLGDMRAAIETLKRHVA